MASLSMIVVHMELDIVARDNSGNECLVRNKTKQHKHEIWLGICYTHVYPKLTRIHERDHIQTVGCKIRARKYNDRSVFAVLLCVARTATNSPDRVSQSNEKQRDTAPSCRRTTPHHIQRERRRRRCGRYRQCVGVCEYRICRVIYQICFKTGPPGENFDANMFESRICRKCTRRSEQFAFVFKKTQNKK